MFLTITKVKQYLKIIRCKHLLNISAFYSRSLIFLKILEIYP